MLDTVDQDFETVSIKVRKGDVTLLDQLAERDWRLRDQQASFMLEDALAAEHERASKPDRPRGTRRRTQTRTNGVARVEA
jgi:hypothetical protein